MNAARNLVNLKDVTKGYSSRTILDDVTLGIAEGDRIGVVGKNGDGKSTLLRMVAGVEDPDSGKLTVAGGVTWRSWARVTNSIRIRQFVRS